MGFLDIFNSKKDKRENLIAETKRFVDQLNLSHKLEPIEVNIFLQKGEQAFYEEGSVGFGEESMVRVGRGNGVAFRVVKGVYYHAGSSQARYVPEIRKTDSGKLYLTNKRLVFTGRFETRIYDLSKIVDLKDFIDAVEVQGVAKKSPYFFVSNPPLWKLIITVVAKGDHLKKLPHVSLTVE